jgi:ATP-binding cassette subfamily F protein 3
MAILTFHNLRQSFAEIDLFSGLSGSIPRDGAIGLVGPNGIGKTTLLRMLAGLSQPKEGEVQLAKGTRLGYLQQEAEEAFINPEHTVYQEMLTAFGDLRAQEAQLRQLEAAMNDGDVSEGLLEKYGHLQQAFELAGGYDYELWLQQVLVGLGFGREQWSMPLSHCSGGQKTRTLLARLLLEKPDLLILDEPTNHLDVEAMEWLENTLRAWEGARLIVSHDRYFLDKVVTAIWEMNRYGLEPYRGNYSAYVQQREERWARREAEFAATQERFLKELDFIKRNIARDSTKDQAQGRLKRLVRHVKAVEVGGTQALKQSWSRFLAEGPGISSEKWGVAEVEGRIKALLRPGLRQKGIKMRFQTGDHFSHQVLQAKNLLIGYPGQPLFQADQIALYRHQCAALIGPNGAGKSTFLRTLLGQIEPLRGEFKLGASLKISYFAQAQSQFDPDKTVLEEFMSRQAALPDQPEMLPGQARDYLARYLFQGEDVYKPVRALSGGELGRLALALLALPVTNFLLLDEPTNHLDIPAQEILQDAIQHFPGTVLLVTHDRYLIDKLATEIWEIRGGKLHQHRGDYQSFLAAREVTREAERQARAEAREAVRAERSRRPDAAARQAAKALAQTEDAIHELETTMAQLQHDLAAASQNQHWEQLQSLGRAYKEAEAQLAALMEKWEALSLAQLEAEE